MEINTHTGGMINKVVLCGNADPARFMRKWRQDLKVENGYRIQASPHDLASLVNFIPPWLKGKRMLCVGGETFGAERFIAEQCGITEIDFTGYPEQNNITALKDTGVKMTHVDSPKGPYNLMVLFGEGEFNLDLVLSLVKVDSLIICLNVATTAGFKGARDVWMVLRRKYRPIVQNTFDEFDCGVGVVVIDHRADLNVDHKKPIYLKGVKNAEKEATRSDLREGKENAADENAADPVGEPKAVSGADRQSRGGSDGLHSPQAGAGKHNSHDPEAANGVEPREPANGVEPRRRGAPKGGWPKKNKTLVEV